MRSNWSEGKWARLVVSVNEVAGNIHSVTRAGPLRPRIGHARTCAQACRQVFPLLAIIPAG